jgi:hypothetical protein
MTKRDRRRVPVGLLTVALFGAVGAASFAACSSTDTGTATSSSTVDAAEAETTPASCPPSEAAAPETGGTPSNTIGAAAIGEGQQTFRFETFGDEAFWGDTLKIHQAIEGKNHGGVGDGLSPKAALAVGLKVDADAIPADVAAGIKAGKVNLDDPATTLALLRLNAVVGVKGTMNADGSLKTLGINCALCHSTVDDSFAPGIGKRLDGWANRDLDVGGVIGLSPDLGSVAAFLGVDEPTVRTVLKSWGPGKFDAELLLDGRATRPDGKSGATLIPPAFGLAGVNLHTYTGWGSIPYWNAFVAVLEMHGQGNFTDSRLDDATKFPVAARHQSGHTHVATDLVGPKLPGLQVYQLALAAPAAKAGSFDVGAAQRGDELFNGQAKCATCHNEPIGTESGWNMHTAAEIGIDEFQSSRSPDNRYRTTPLRGLWTHTKGGFYHDGRFATLPDVITHYDTTFQLGLTDAQKGDLVEYLKSL